MLTVDPAVLKAAGPDHGRIGYIGRTETPVPVWEDLAAGLGDVEWVDVETAFEAVSQRHFPDAQDRP